MAKIRRRPALSGKTWAFRRRVPWVRGGAGVAAGLWCQDRLLQPQASLADTALQRRGWVRFPCEQDRMLGAGPKAGRQGIHRVRGMTWRTSLGLLSCFGGRFGSEFDHFVCAVAVGFDRGSPATAERHSLALSGHGFPGGCEDLEVSADQQWPVRAGDD
jgi:hypothetical protein